MISSIARYPSQVEPLEARIAPAVVLTNPIPDLVAGVAKTNVTIDLGKLTAATASDIYRTTVQFTTNYDTDPNTAGLQAGVIVIELYDDVAPLSVQNFLDYLTSASSSSDYDNTIIHRSFNFGDADPDGDGPLEAPLGNDIIQGGGFDFSNLAAHIPTNPEVHNEYSPLRPNVRGTLAMAKTGEGPNTGTSEWFFNVNDNSSILNETNGNSGGYAVFGKVISGMDVVDAIAGLTTHNLGSVYSDIPLMNYTSGVPTADQVIRIVDAVVVLKTPIPSSGLTYSVQVVQPGTSTPSDLLAATVNGSTLGLAFASGKSGIAEVRVQVSDGTDTATDTFTVDVRPNLYVDLTQDSMPRFLLPGDVGSVKFNLVNNGAATAKNGSVNVYLTKVTVTKNSFGQITGSTVVSPESSIVVKSGGALAYNIASGKAQAFSVPVNVPTTPFDSDEVYYKVVTEIVPAGDERFSDDNKSTETSLHLAVNKFGTLSDINFGTRLNAVLKYTGENTDGVTGFVTWTMKGPGTGTVGFNAQKENMSLTTVGTTLASTLTPTFSKAGSHIALEGINFTSGIGTANLGLVDVSGLIAISGGVKTLKLGNLSGDSLLLISPVLFDPNIKAAITVGQVTDFSIESSQALASLTVGSWADTAGSPNDSIIAPSLGTLKVNGNFEADLTLVEEVPLTSIKVTGWLKNATIKTAGNIGSVNLGGIDTANVFAGIDSRPDALSDFANARTIQSFTIAGIKGYTGDLFINSQVAAQTLGSIIVKGVDPTGTGDYGFVADVIKSYSRAAAPGTPALVRTNLTTPQIVDDLGDYLVRIL